MSRWIKKNVFNVGCAGGTMTLRREIGGPCNIGCNNIGKERCVLSRGECNRSNGLS
jgi:hypothetical protein